MTVLEERVLSNINHISERLIDNEKNIVENAKKIGEIADELKKLNANIKHLTETLGRIAYRM